MDLRKLKNLSVLGEYHIYGPARTKYLKDLEDYLNSTRFEITFTQLSILSLIGKNMNINTPLFWKQLGSLVTENIHRTGDKNTDTLSMIHRNFIVKYPMIGDQFFKLLESRMFALQDYLSNMSVTNLARGMCLRRVEDEKALREIEKLCVKRMKGLSKLDLGNLGSCMSIHNQFATSEEFKVEFGECLGKGIEGISISMLINISRGIASRGWYYEKVVKEIVNSVEENVQSLSYIQITQIAWALAEYDKGIEIPLLEKAMDKRL